MLLIEPTGVRSVKASKSLGDLQTTRHYYKNYEPNHSCKLDARSQFFSRTKTLRTERKMRTKTAHVNPVIVFVTYYYGYFISRLKIAKKKSCFAYQVMRLVSDELCSASDQSSYLRTQHLLRSIFHLYQFHIHMLQPMNPM